MHISHAASGKMISSFGATDSSGHTVVAAVPEKGWGGMALVAGMVTGGAESSGSGAESGGGDGGRGKGGYKGEVEGG